MKLTKKELEILKLMSEDYYLKICRSINNLNPVGEKNATDFEIFNEVVKIIEKINEIEPV